MIQSGKYYTMSRSERAKTLVDQTNKNPDTQNKTNLQKTKHVIGLIQGENE